MKCIILRMYVSREGWINSTLMHNLKDIGMMFIFIVSNYTPVAMVVHVEYILYSALFWTLQVSLGHSMTPD